jgi:hypothetical protein
MDGNSVLLSEFCDFEDVVHAAVGKLRRRSDQHASGTGNNKIKFLLGYNFSTLLFSFKRQIKLWTENNQMNHFSVVNLYHLIKKVTKNCNESSEMKIFTVVK